MRREVSGQIASARELTHKVNRQAVFFVLGASIATAFTNLLHR